MPRITIRQFRAMLGESPGQSMRPYRQIAHRPALVAAMHAQGWPVWEDGAASRSAVWASNLHLTGHEH